MKRLAYVVLAATLLLTCSACGSQKSENTVQNSEASTELFAMDTYLNLTAYGEKAETALKQAQNRIRELESLWPVTDEHSEIYAANHSGGEQEHLDFEMILLTEDRTIYVTDGLSDVFSLGTGQEGREVRIIDQKS